MRRYSLDTGQEMKNERGEETLEDVDLRGRQEESPSPIFKSLGTEGKKSKGKKTGQESNTVGSGAWNPSRYQEILAMEVFPPVHNRTPQHHAHHSS